MVAEVTNAESLIDRHRDAWLAATERSPFVRAVRDGTVEREAFRRWLAQDRLFVDGLYAAQARILALAGGEARRALLGGLVALQAELDWFEGQAVRFGVALDVAPIEDCSRYLDYLQTLAFAPPSVALTAIWAVERSYLDAWRAARPGAEPYREFVEHWSNKAFAEYVERLRAGADEALARASGADRAAAERAFRRVVDLERRFWQMTGER